MKTLTFAPGARGELTFARPPADYVETLVLTPGVANGIFLPGGARFVVFSATGDFYALPVYTGNPVYATVPVGTTTNGSGCELNPGHWSLQGMEGISVIAADDCIVTVSVYS